jgi:hypothetical protein
MTGTTITIITFGGRRSASRAGTLARSVGRLPGLRNIRASRRWGRIA